MIANHKFDLNLWQRKIYFFAIAINRWFVYIILTRVPIAKTLVTSAINKLLSCAKLSYNLVCVFFFSLIICMMLLLLLLIFVASFSLCSACVKKLCYLRYRRNLWCGQRVHVLERDYFMEFIKIGIWQARVLHQLSRIESIWFEHMSSSSLLSPSPRQYKRLKCIAVRRVSK